MTTIKIEDCDFIQGKFLFCPVISSDINRYYSQEPLSVVGVTKTVIFTRAGRFDKESLAINVWKSANDEFILFNWYWSDAPMLIDVKKEKFRIVIQLWNDEHGTRQDYSKDQKTKTMVDR